MQAGPRGSEHLEPARRGDDGQHPHELPRGAAEDLHLDGDAALDHPAHEERLDREQHRAACHPERAEEVAREG